MIPVHRVQRTREQREKWRTRTERSTSARPPRRRRTSSSRRRPTSMCASSWPRSSRSTRRRRPTPPDSSIKVSASQPLSSLPPLVHELSRHFFPPETCTCCARSLAPWARGACLPSGWIVGKRPDGRFCFTPCRHARLLRLGCASLFRVAPAAGRECRDALERGIRVLIPWSGESASLTRRDIEVS